MVVTCWSVKGGSGTTVVAACLALAAARGRDRATLLVDTAGDVPAVLGVDEPVGGGFLDWLAVSATVATGASSDPTDRHGGVPLPPTDAEIRVDERLSVLPRGSSPTGPGGPSPTGVTERLMECLGADGRFVVVDAGIPGAGENPDVATALVDRADRSLLVIRPCYLALRQLTRSTLRVDGVVLVEEPGRSLDAGDVASVAGAPVVATVRFEPQVSRLVDAGLLCSRLPRGVERTMLDVVGD